MKIKVINKQRLEKEHNYYEPEYEFEVYAIAKFGRENYFLVNIYNGLFWWKGKLFKIIDNSTSEDWVNVKFKYFNRIKNLNYNFSIPLNNYIGPKEFLENKDFLFDIYENPSYAYEFFYDFLKKDGSK